MPLVMHQNTWGNWLPHLYRFIKCQFLNVYYFSLRAYFTFHLKYKTFVGSAVKRLQKTIFPVVIKFIDIKFFQEQGGLDWM